MMEESAKSFKVVAVSLNANSFGLHSVVFMARDGTAVEGLRTRQFKPKEGDVLSLGPNPLDDLTSRGYECPRSLPKAPKNVVQEVWNGH